MVGAINCGLSCLEEKSRTGTSYIYTALLSCRQAGFAVSLSGISILKTHIITVF